MQGLYVIFGSEGFLKGFAIINGEQLWTMDVERAESFASLQEAEEAIAKVDYPGLHRIFHIVRGSM